MEEVIYKLKKDGEVGIGQMKKYLKFGKITLATVHGTDWRGTIMEVEVQLGRYGKILDKR